MSSGVDGCKAMRDDGCKISTTDMVSPYVLIAFYSSYVANFKFTSTFSRNYKPSSRIFLIL